MREFIRQFLARNGLPQPTNAVKGEVFVHINQGRYIVDCPTSSCGGAMVVSSQDRIFVCPICGSPENNRAWYRVVFPPQKEQIERELLKRPAKDGWRAVTRNWEPKESVDELRQQNRDKGIE